MAFELGITTSAYSKIEREESNISIKRLEEIATILEVEVIDFFREPNATSVSDNANTQPATKNDVEVMVKMIQELTLEVSSLRTNLTGLNFNGLKSVVTKSVVPTELFAHYLQEP